ncbi:hypothetical protein Anas_11992 [Armadillidium nasatum]|uniref:ShKT domain-containing protein n=1 Tax=Armadillidium nasatum TaxID=96803 RepID=A0A5N5TEI1_9CRUS|nr:hypothetical protein Anas_11992 [Armadillidium nasatum]
MHYGENAFAIDRSRPTIVAKDGSKIVAPYPLRTKRIAKLKHISIHVYFLSLTIMNTLTFKYHSYILEFSVKYFILTLIFIRDTEKINKLYRCGGLTGVTGPSVTQPPPIPLPDKCLDSNDYCAQWAQAGECDTNPEWMHPNCKKSCKQYILLRINNTNGAVMEHRRML